MTNADIVTQTNQIIAAARAVNAELAGRVTRQQRDDPMYEASASTGGLVGVALRARGVVMLAIGEES